MQWRKISSFLSSMLIVSLAITSIIPKVYSASAKVYMYPSMVAANVGTSFTVEVKISDAVDVFSWQFRLEWNATVLDFVSVEEGDFLEDQPEGTYFVNTTEQDNIGTDYIVVFCTTLGDWSGVSGLGTLATVTFLVEDIGETPLLFHNPYPAEPADTFLLSSQVTHIDFTAEDGLFTNGADLLATVDVNPNTLNLKSEGKWITAYIQLPEGYNPEDMDASTILFNEILQPILDPKYDFVANSSEYLVDNNEDGILERVVKFDKAEATALLDIGEATLTITGKVKGIPFEGGGTIRVTGE